MAIQNPFKNIMPKVISGAKEAVSKLPSLLPKASSVETKNPTISSLPLSKPKEVQTLSGAAAGPSAPVFAGGAKTMGTTSTGASVGVPTPTQNQVQQQGINQGLTGADLQRSIEASFFSPQPTQQTAPAPQPTQPRVQDLTPTAPAPAQASIPSGPSNADLLRGTVGEARQRLLALMSPSEREIALQDELAEFQESARLGLASLEGQGRGIPLGLVRGQQAKLQEQAGIQEQTMLQKLANEVANRQAQAQALGYELSFADKDLERALQEEAKKQPGTPFEFDGNLVQYNPATGQVEVLQEGRSAAEGFTLSEGQARYDANGNLVAIGLTKPVDPLAQQKQLLEIQKLQNELMGGGDMNQMLTIKELADLGLPQSTFGITRGQAINAIQAGTLRTGDQKAAESAVFSLQNKMAEIQSLLANDSGLKGMVGVGPLSTVSFNPSRQREFKATIDQLTSRETLDTLLALKAQGGTLGAISEKELAILAEAATKFSTFWDEDKGKYKVREEVFVEELDKLYKSSEFLMNQLNEILSAPTYQNQQGSYGDIDSWLNSFNNDLSTSQNGFGNLNNTQNLPPVQKTVSNLFGQGIVTGYGSKFWSHGLDYVLPGGKNAQVKLPVQTTVVAVKPASQTNGFGNQVQLRMPDGQTVWVSHLDKMLNVQPGTVLPPNTTFGTQGNTGKTYGPTGIHLDITMPKPGGGYYNPRQVASYLNTIG